MKAGITAAAGFGQRTPPLGPRVLQAEKSSPRKHREVATDKMTGATDQALGAGATRGPQKQPQGLDEE